MPGGVFDARYDDDFDGGGDINDNDRTINDYEFHKLRAAYLSGEHDDEFHVTEYVFNLPVVDCVPDEHDDDHIPEPDHDGGDDINDINDNKHLDYIRSRFINKPADDVDIKHINDLLAAIYDVASVDVHDVNDSRLDLVNDLCYELDVARNMLRRTRSTGQ